MQKITRQGHDDAMGVVYRATRNAKPVRVLTKDYEARILHALRKEYSLGQDHYYSRKEYSLGQDHYYVNLTRPKPRVTGIVAMNHDRVIGKGGGMPWHIPSDLKFFRRMTMGRALVVGRKTFQNIGVLPGRQMYVMSRKPMVKGWPDVETYQSKKEIIDEATDLFVIGGAEVYRQWMPYMHDLIVSRVDVDVRGTKHFPSFEHSFRKMREEPGEDNRVTREYWETKSLRAHYSRHAHS